MEIYTCRKPERLSAIAGRFGLTPAALQHCNGLNHCGPLPTGFSLLIPGGTDSPPRPAELYLCSSRPLPDSRLEAMAPFLSAMLLPPGSCRAGQLKRAGITPILLLDNRDTEGIPEPALAHEMLREEECRRVWAEDALRQVQAEGCSGLCLHLPFVRPFDRDRLSALLLQLSELLHREGLYFMLAAAPPGDDTPNPASAALDFSLLGRCCDRVFLQCYDWGHRDSPPQAPAPLPRLRQSVELTLAHISPERLVLGLAGHGYCWQLPWQPGQQAEAIGHGRARELAVSCGEEIRWDRFAQSPFFSFHDPAGRRHGLWYEDVRSLRQKLLLLSDYKLAGAALFGPGLWDEGSLALIRALLYPQPLP